MFTIGGIFLGIVQIHRQVFYYGQNTLDARITLMIWYSRITSLACNLKDGDLLKKNRDKPDLKSREK
jgi:hypothetical protein